MNDFKLDSRPNIKSGFKAPDAYFESLADRVMLSLPMEDVKVIPLYKRRPVWVTSAAAVFVLSFSLLLNQKDTVINPVLPDNKSIEEYVIVNKSEISTNELLKNLSDKDLQELQQDLITADDESIGDFIGDDIYRYQ